MAIHLAVDIGGTFTDAVGFDANSGRIFLGKSSTTPAAHVDGVIQASWDSGLNPEAVSMLTHGSTVVINALLERNGAKSALITTRGFRDVYEIGRINRPESFNLFFEKHQPLVERSWCFEINERISAEGEILTPLDLAEVARLGVHLKALEVEAIAVVFLHAYRNPRHELAVKHQLQQILPDVYVTASHELSREYREYERTSTTVANAYVGPVVSRYLDELEVRLSAQGFRGHLAIMQSNGGLSQLSVARQQCVQMMESGPAGGLTGTQVLCGQLDIDRAIAFDMGGTTAKAGVVVDGQTRLAEDYFVGGYNRGLPIRVPVLDITEVGTGGGSIARLAPGLAIRVGPQSAGADPGPVAYGRGGMEPTVTDANLVLGRIDPRRFLGGRMVLDQPLAAAAIRDSVARPLDMSVEQAAEGILQIAVAQMGHAVRAVTTAKGLDPRDFVMVAYGGAGPLHAVELARELYIPTVLIPPMPAHFSALGMLLADFRHDLVRTHIARLDRVELNEVDRWFDALAEEALAGIGRNEANRTSQVIRRAADMRYVGQEHTVLVEWPDRLDQADAREIVKSRFDRVHAQRYSHSAPEEPAEIVNLRIRLTVELAKPELPRLQEGSTTPPRSAERPHRPVVFRAAAGAWDTPVWDRSELMVQNRIEGPAIVEETTSTTVLPPGASLMVGPYGELRIEVLSHGTEH